MGGTWTSLVGVGALITMFFSYNLMMASLIRKLYFFNARFPGELAKTKKPKETLDLSNPDGKVKVLKNVKKVFDDEEDVQAELLKKAYARQQEAAKTGKAQLKESLRTVFGSKKADFHYATSDIIKSLLCCRMMLSEKTLRDNEKYRNDLYFNRGLKALSKESDMGYILHQLRTTRYFLRTVLEKDQRVLLKLKDRS
jgi:hypothetical protein